MRSRFVVGLVILLLALGSARAMFAHPIYTPDGWYYGRTLLNIRHVPAAVAERTLDDFYRATPIGRSQKYRTLFIPNERPASFRAVGAFFSFRLLYPALAAPLYPRFGLQSLIVVSLAAYVVASIAMYLGACAFARPVLAAAATICFMVSNAVRVLAQSSLTDMVAIALWAIIFALLLYVPRARLGGRLTLIAGLEIALVLTRPLIFMPLTASFCAMFSREARRAIWQRWIFAVSLVVTLGFLIIGARSDSPGIVASIVWEYHRSIETGSTAAGQPIAIWYIAATARCLAVAIVHGVKEVVPFVSILVALFLRKRAGLAVLNGTLLAGLLIIVINPEPGQVDRTLLAPLMPAFAAYVAIGLEQLAQLLVRLNGASPLPGRLRTRRLRLP